MDMGRFGVDEYMKPNQPAQNLGADEKQIREIQAHVTAQMLAQNKCIYATVGPLVSAVC